MPAFDEEYLRHFPDRAFRKLLEDPRNLRELVAELAPDLAEGFNFSRLTPVPRDFLLEDWRRRESDLLFRVPYAVAGEERETLVCVLVEHQSAPDARMPLRMLLYAVLYWERQWKAWETEPHTGESLELTPVLPIVFHTGPRRWSAGRELADLMQGPDSLRCLAPAWPVLFWDLAERSVEELLGQSSDWLRSLAVVRAEREDAARFEEVFRSVLARLEPLGEEQSIRWHDLMWFVLSWAFRRRPHEETEQLKQTAATSHQDRLRRREVAQMSETVWQTRDEWMFQQGETQGIARGEIQARREDLRDLLEERFGRLPEELSDKIAATQDMAILKAAIRQAIRISKIEELRL